MGVFLHKCLLGVLLVAVFFISTGTNFVHAGFGITPPYVSNTSLTRNSIYEQQILLVRGDPTTAQKAEISVDAPEIASWIEVIEGDVINLPRGEQKVPMTVRVTVPDNAEFKTYEGSIRIRTVPDSGEVTQGAVNISLGALVDIDLTVIDREIKDFRLRRVSVEDLNEGTKYLWLFFPGKIRFDMAVENIGNVDVSPSNVDLRIYDRSGKVLLEEVDTIGRIKRIKPYATETVTASIPTRLPAGSYVARYRVYNDDEVKQEGDLTMNILPAGTLETAGFGFIGLSIAHKISILLPIFSLMIALLYLYRGLRSKKRRSS
jgi:hypothetical protein